MATKTSFQIKVNVLEAIMTIVTAEQVVKVLNSIFPEAEFNGKTTMYPNWVIQGRLRVEKQPTKKQWDSWVWAAKGALAMRDSL